MLTPERVAKIAELAQQYPHCLPHWLPGADLLALCGAVEERRSALIALYRKRRDTCAGLEQKAVEKTDWIEAEWCKRERIWYDNLAVELGCMDAREGLAPGAEEEANG